MQVANATTNTAAFFRAAQAMRDAVQGLGPLDALTTLMVFALQTGPLQARARAIVAERIPSLTFGPPIVFGADGAVICSETREIIGWRE